MTVVYGTAKGYMSASLNSRPEMGPYWLDKLDFDVVIDSNIVDTKDENLRFVKQTVDYTATILGLWECQELTGIETYNDANARLEFFADGTYRYWRQNEDGTTVQQGMKWVKVDE